MFMVFPPPHTQFLAKVKLTYNFTEEYGEADRGSFINRTNNIGGRLVSADHNDPVSREYIVSIPDGKVDAFIELQAARHSENSLEAQNAIQAKVERIDD